MKPARRRRGQAPPSPLGALTWRHKGNQAGAREKFWAVSPTWPSEQLDEVAKRAYEDALILAALVRDEEPRVLFGALTEYSHEQLSLLAVALAALVPIDLPVSRLTEWFTWSRSARAG